MYGEEMPERLAKETSAGRATDRLESGAMLLDSQVRKMHVKEIRPRTSVSSSHGGNGWEEKVRAGPTRLHPILGPGFRVFDGFLPAAHRNMPK